MALKLNKSTAPKQSTKRARTDTPPSPDGLLPAFRALLDQQTERLEERLETLAATFKEKIVEIEHALQFQSEETVKLSGKIKKVEQQVIEKETRLQDEVDRLATYIARENLIISGLAEVNGEDIKAVLSDFYVDKLKMPEDVVARMEYQRAHRISSMPTTPSKPRPIKVRFMRYEDKVEVQKHAKHLKGSTLYIADDLPKNVRRARQLQVPALKAARQEGKLAYFSRSDPKKLIIK